MDGKTFGLHKYNNYNFTTCPPTQYPVLMLFVIIFENEEHLKMTAHSRSLALEKAYTLIEQKTGRPRSELQDVINVEFCH